VGILRIKSDVGAGTEAMVVQIGSVVPVLVIRTQQSSSIDCHTLGYAILDKRDIARIGTREYAVDDDASPNGASLPSGKS
jgi:hypothetical protein